ncbi:type II toxin-antitoxin system HicA family toxin [Candidatus Peregrinibacteria bacterium]|nr:type II toxin-antitoxin system HicA family toxin [Candidatus Peregrinibacteria bacterium]
MPSQCEQERNYENKIHWHPKSRAYTCLNSSLSNGFVERDAQGSHVFFKHKDGRTTVVPIHNRELSKGLLRKILNDVQLTVEEYEKLRK